MISRIIHTKPTQLVCQMKTEGHDQRHYAISEQSVFLKGLPSVRGAHSRVVFCSCYRDKLNNSTVLW
jgi:hypothetical protein